MMTFFLAAMLSTAAQGPCTMPESMPAPGELTAGEGDVDWCLRGIDPFGLAGPDLKPVRQILVTDPESDAVQLIQWRRSDADPVPPTWRVAFKRTATATMPGEYREVLIQRLGDNLIIVTVNPAWRIGNAMCFGEGGTMTGYLPAGVEPTASDTRAIEDLTNPDPPEKVEMAIDGSAAAGQYDTVEIVTSGGGTLDPANIMCTLLTADGDQFRPSFRGPGGRPLDYYDEARWRAVGAGDYARYLRITR